MSSRDYHDAAVRLYTGDAVEVLGRLPGSLVDCVVTSPPYWGLRDYRVPGQYGVEPTLDEYVDALVAVFDQVARVLRQDGSVWLNLGDSYGGSWGNYIAAGSTAPTATTRRGLSLGVRRPPQSRHRAKDLIGVPWRVVFALQEQGWVLRDAVVWAKPNPRPESVRDRLSQCYEWLFLLGYGHHTRQCPVPGVPVGGSGAVWTVAADRAGTGHRAAGTLEIAQRCVRLGCPRGGVVLDPFSGSGTTGIAALRYGCRYIGIDLDPASNRLAWARLFEMEAGDG